MSFSANADAAGSSSSAETPAVSHDPSGCEEQDVAEEGGGEQTADDSKCLPEETEADEDSAQDDPSPSATPQDEQELFNSFHYWRTPIPEIDLDLELLEEEKRPSAPALGRKQLEELIENLEPHIDDPDVKGERCFFLMTIRKWFCMEEQE